MSEETPATPLRQSAHDPYRDIRDAAGRIDLKCLDLPSLERWVQTQLREKPARALQLYKWLWQRGARSFDEMTDISAKTRRKLAAKSVVTFLEPEIVLRSSDGTVKFLWRLFDGNFVESVLIPDGDRLTLCMSSQVGCAMGCRFCLTGDLGLIRHLRASEITNQVLQVGLQLPEGERVTNLVLMGMGEPLHNLENLLVALRNTLSDQSLNYSHRKITVSTVGLIPKLAELAAALPVNLAVSLNASTSEQRHQLMPIDKRYPLQDLMEACREFPLPPGKRITFEYVMLAGINDSLEDAARLYELLRGIKAKVNLIPYNENPDRSYLRSSDETVKAFQHYLVSQQCSCSVRTTRGTDISAACGQLGKARQQAADHGWLETARSIAGLDEL